MKMGKTAVKMKSETTSQSVSLIAHLAPSHRLTTWQGKDYLVAPGVLITEGVHAGSAGPVFYSAQQLSRMPLTWNGRPVPILHPQVDGQPITCNDPAVIEQQNVGHIFNVEWDDETRRLKGEVWIDVQKAKALCSQMGLPDVVNAITSGRQVEVSTGMFTESYGPAGVWNGEEYVSSAIGIHADHLALLPGGKGACSWEDGCGIRNMRNPMENDPKSIWNSFSDEQQHVLSSMLGQKKISDDQDLSQTIKVLVERGVRDFTANQAGVDYRDLLRQLQSIADGLDTQSSMNFVEAVYDDRFIYRRESPSASSDSFPRPLMRGPMYFMQPYQVDANTGEVQLVGEPERVRREVSFPTVLQQQQEIQNMSQQNCQCVEKVNAVIASSANAFTEDDREVLSGMPEKVLDKIPLSAPVSVQNQTKEATFDDLLANADPEMRQSIERGRELYRQERGQMVQAVLSAPACQFTEQELQAMDHGLLRKVSASVARAAPVRLAAGGAPAPVQDDQEEGLEAPWKMADAKQA